MAIYKNREVQITSYITDVSPVVEIQHQSGEREFVNLRNLQFTEDEKKEFSKDQDNIADGVAVIKDKDLQDLRDSQDPEKIQKEKDKQNKTVDVPVSKIKVDAEEIRKNK
jgi:hypothetical protein